MWLSIFTLSCLFLKLNCDYLPCNSTIYCHGQLLHTVQMERLFNDSKTFVDMKLNFSPEEVLSNFEKFVNGSKDDKVSKFVELNFQKENALENWKPPDYREDPPFLKNIQNETVLKFAQDLIKIWPLLAKKIKPDVYLNQDRYSLIPVKNGFVVAGGRFNEYYYWDTYWILEGLILSDMVDTAKGMIENFISLVQRFGFVPNGGRIYYLNRSQPPLLTKMAYMYYEHSKNIQWVEQNIQYLEKELEYWLQTQTVDIELENENVTLARYYVKNSTPRPESYYEDYSITYEMKDPIERETMYTALTSGAESGWDFSSRWYSIINETIHTNLSHIDTLNTIPVDLNAILCGSFKDLGKLYHLLGKKEKCKYWFDKASQWQEAIASVLWDEDDKVWYDYDLKLSRRRKYFYPSNIMPLWTKCFDKEDGPKIGDGLVEYLKREGIHNFLGGIPTSLQQTGEQWDFPNAWPPLQDIVVDSLEKSGSKAAQALARSLAQTWINANMHGFSQSGVMYEKYDAEKFGVHGGGGEYAVQVGFGWSNGVALKFISKYFVNL